MTIEKAITYKTTKGNEYKTIVECVENEVMEQRIDDFAFDKYGFPNYDLHDVIILVYNKTTAEIVNLMVEDFGEDWDFDEYGVYMWHEHFAEWILIANVE